MENIMESMQFIGLILSSIVVLASLFAVPYLYKTHKELNNIEQS